MRPAGVCGPGQGRRAAGAPVTDPRARRAARLPLGRAGAGKADAEAACNRVAQAQERLDATRAELGSLEDRQAQLAGAPKAYADALVAKEQYLTHSAGLCLSSYSVQPGW